MDRINNRIAQAYGYAVCFITVIMMLFSIKSVVDAAIDLSDPLRAEGSRSGRTLTNFEVYKIEMRSQGVRPGPVVPVAPAKGGIASDSTTSDADLRRLYDAEGNCDWQRPLSRRANAHRQLVSDRARSGSVRNPLALAETP